MSTLFACMLPIICCFLTTEAIENILATQRKALQDSILELTQESHTYSASLFQTKLDTILDGYDIKPDKNDIYAYLTRSLERKKVVLEEARDKHSYAKKQFYATGIPAFFAGFVLIPISVITNDSITQQWIPECRSMADSDSPYFKSTFYTNLISACFMTFSGTTLVLEAGHQKKNARLCAEHINNIEAHLQFLASGQEENS